MVKVRWIWDWDGSQRALRRRGMPQDTAAEQLVPWQPQRLMLRRLQRGCRVGRGEVQELE